MGQHRYLFTPQSVTRLPVPVLGAVLKHLFLALDCLHTKCHFIHTDIKADNIMLGIADNSVPKYSASLNRKSCNSLLYSKKGS